MRPSRAEPVAISIHGSCRDASPGAKGRRSRNTLGHKAGRHATKTPRGSGKKCRWPCKASEPCGKQGCRCRGLVGSGCPLGACVAERGSRPPWPSGSGKGFGARVSGGVVSRRRQRIRASLAGDCRRDRGHVASPFLTAGRRGTASVQSHGATAQHVPCLAQINWQTSLAQGQTSSTSGLVPVHPSVAGANGNAPRDALSFVAGLLL